MKKITMLLFITVIAVSCSRKQESTPPGQETKTQEIASTASEVATPEIMLNGISCKAACNKAKTLGCKDRMSAIFNPDGAKLYNGELQDCMAVCTAKSKDPEFISLADEDIPCVIKSTDCEQWIKCARSEEDF